MRAVAIGLIVSGALAGTTLAQSGFEYGPNCSGGSDHTVIDEAVDIGSGIVMQTDSTFYSAESRMFDWVVFDCAASIAMRVHVFRSDGAIVEKANEVAVVARQDIAISDGQASLNARLATSAEAHPFKAIKAAAMELGMSTEVGLMSHCCGCQLYYPEITLCLETLQ